MSKKKKVNIFEDMKAALRDAVDLRVTRMPARPKPISAMEIRRIRKALKASQPVFATYLNFSANAVRSWEQGARKPRNAALKLHTIAKKHPRVLLVA